MKNSLAPLGNSDTPYLIFLGFLLAVGFSVFAACIWRLIQLWS